ncbi:N-6 DNA methylase [bacterium]|nr:N-6 DNA methylase [bacterium]
MENKKYTKTEAKESVKKLVVSFHNEFGDTANAGRKEAQVEDKYIKPLFSFLNWNIHSLGMDRGREEFRVQTSQKLRTSTKEPDYELWIPDKASQEMRRILFMEAKDPKYDLSKEVKYIRQAYQYAHSSLSLSDNPSKWTNLSILTDFEEFRLFDCRDPYPLIENDVNIFNKYIVKPFDMKYPQYITEFNLLWDVFERNNVYNGSLSEFQVTEKDLKKSRIAPDQRFLDDLRTWRLAFAKSMYKSNKEVSNEFLTAATQLMINRIIFLKMLTDRDIEEDYLTKILDKIKNEKKEISIYDSCRDIFEGLNKTYNGDIFQRRGEFDFVKIENGVFKSVIESLIPEKSVYTLAAMPVEIIGNAYEQFLGEVIVHKGRGISSERKPEVQKAGGVYYTPKYIVDYIVENTVGEKLKSCKKPSDVEKIKILDPACGSGSFLLGAYEYLLSWHEAYFVKEIEKMLEKGKSSSNITKKFKEEIKYYPISEEIGGHKFLIHLTSKVKRKILLNNLFGVDIDSNAIEITKFSLSMKALEGLNKREIGDDVTLFHEQILPSLENNIKCGNSLIGNDYFEDKLQFDDRELKEINPFDWEAEFPYIFNDGGFDCAIGNPPYLPFHLGSKEIKKYFCTNYQSAIGKYDQYIIFTEKSLQLLKNQGEFGFIIPNKFIHSNYGKGLKKVILKRNIRVITDFGDIQIFSNATNYPCILIIRNNEKWDSFKYNKVSHILSERFSYNVLEINQKTLNTDSWLLISEREGKIVKKIVSDNIPLKKISIAITQGIRTGLLTIFYNNINKEFVRLRKIERKLIKPIFHGKNVKRYYSTVDFNNDIMLFPYKDDCKSPIDINEFPNTKMYLEGYKEKLLSRKDSGKVFRNVNKKWFEFWDSKYISFTSPKIVFPDISKANNFYLDEDGIGYLNTCYAIILKEASMYRFVLGILNSTLIEFFIKKNSPYIRGGYYRYKTKYIEKIPIPYIDNSDLNFIPSYNKIVDYVDRMLLFQGKYHSAKTEQDKELYQKQIYVLDRKIDDLVYKLYGLTDEEIEIVEGKFKN